MFSKKNIALFAILIILIAAGYFYKEYQRKPADESDVEPAAKVTAAAIASLFESDEAKANQQYLNKTIQVAGTITEIINQQDTLVNVTLGDAGAMHKVSCLLDKRHTANIKNYATGQPVAIKGKCTGFLIDVELNRCVIVDTDKQ